MDSLKRLKDSPIGIRVAPFAVFLILTSLQGKFGEDSRYWFYVAKTLVGAWMVWAVRPLIREMRWSFSWEAVAVGIGVFVMWVGIDNLYPHLSSFFGKDTEEPAPLWNPLTHFENAPALAWFIVIVRLVGSSLVVPPLEEVFYRSFVYRYVVNPDFEKVPLNKLAWNALIITSVIFALTHEQWLAAIICGIAYQMLTIRKGRLGDAMTAHAITNFLLAIYVIWKGAWQFW